MNGSQGCTERESLIAYLYDECDDLERRRVERHIESCGVCAADLSGLRRVRGSLAGWMPPDVDLGFRIAAEAEDRGWWRAWQPPIRAQALAAMLVLGVAAAVANLDVRYGSDGLTVRTGWLRADRAGVPAPVTSGASVAPWRPELTSLEQQLRRDFGLMRPVSTADRAPATSPTVIRDDAAMNPDLLRRVRAIVDESERTQQRELALRVAQLYREMDVQRRADLLRIEQNFGQIEGQTGEAIAQQREWLNHLVRASQRR